MLRFKCVRSETNFIFLPVPIHPFYKNVLIINQDKVQVLNPA